MIKDLRREIENISDKKKAVFLQKYFKTRMGEYAEGDFFLGIAVPQCREIAIKYSSLNLKDLKILIGSKIHEERLIALLILVHKFEKEVSKRKEIYDFYLSHTKNINNWDLVDLSSHHIVGEYLLDKPKDILVKLARSKNFWERRIALISTFAFIREKDFDMSLKLAEILVKDKEDLIQKALGWMLREIGKRDLAVEEKFLVKHYEEMGRTTLRYAIERFPEQKRLAYLHGKIK